MPNQVIKADGSRQPFDEARLKISIGAAAKGADLTEERSAEVVEQVSRNVFAAIAEKEEIATSEIREITLSELDKVEPSVAGAWRTYDRNRGKG